MVLSTAALLALIVSAVQQALPIAEKIAYGEIQFEMAAILQVVNSQLEDSKSQLGKFGSISLVAVWLTSILHSYYLGARCD